MKLNQIKSNEGRIEMEKSYVGTFNCYYCGKTAGVLLNKRLRKTLTQNMGVLDSDPCNECKKLMDQGIMFISIRNETTNEEMNPKDKGLPNPFRTGKIAVVKEQAVKQIINNDKMLEFALKYRFMFITDEAWERLGLPNKKINNSNEKD